MMDKAELRAALKKAEAKPMSCVVGLDGQGQAVILLDRHKGPRKLLAEVKARGRAENLDLDPASLRRGRVSMSDGEPAYALNKAVPPPVKQAMKAPMRAAGHAKFTINADPSIEDEPDEEVDGAEGTGAATSAPATGSAASPPAAAPGPAMAAAAPGTAAAPPLAGPVPGPAPVPAASAAAQAPGISGNGAPGRAALLAAVPPDLAAGVRATLSADPGRKGELAGLLAQVRAGVDGSDQAAAEAGIAALREAVAPAAPPPAAAPPAVPDRARDAVPRPGARDAATAPPLVVPEPPALAADTGLSSLARAWEAEQARAGQEAGQEAGQDGTARRALDPAQVGADVAAMMRGMDRGRAEGTGGGVQVAQASQPGVATATDAGGPGPAERDGMTHWGSLPRPGSQPFPGAVRPARDWRPLLGVGQVVLGAAGLAVGGALGVVGAGETGLGLATTPLGVGVPITGMGVATIGLGLAVTGGGAATAYEGMGNIFAPFRDPRPLLPGVLPGALPPQDPAANAEAARRWLADNPPPDAAGGPAAPAPPVPDLSGARVNLGPVALSPLPPGPPGALAGNRRLHARPAAAAAAGPCAAFAGCAQLHREPGPAAGHAHINGHAHPGRPLGAPAHGRSAARHAARDEHRGKPGRPRPDTAHRPHRRRAYGAAGS